MSLSRWIELLSARWNGAKDAGSALPERPEPNPYYVYLAQKARWRATGLQRRFWREDRLCRQRWIRAQTRRSQAVMDLARLARAADDAGQRYALERARDQEEAAALNPPGRAYVPVGLYWLLLGLLIAGDAAISYTAFLTIGDVTPWMVGALSLMVVVAMVVIGHVIGDRLRHGTTGRWSKIGLVATVVVISVVMTVFREQAQAEALAAGRSAELAAVTIGQAVQAPVDTTAGSSFWSVAMLPSFFMFLLVTMMGVVVPAILAYYVERRPRLLGVAQAGMRLRQAKARLQAGQRRIWRAERRVAQLTTYRLARYKEAQVRLDESRDHMYWLMSAYAMANMRRRGLQELHPSLRDRPEVPGGDLLAALDWSEPSAGESTAPGKAHFEQGGMMVE